MNKERRKLIDDAKGMLEQARDEEQDYFDNMPEAFQNGEKGETAQTAIDALENAIGELENIE